MAGVRNSAVFKKTGVDNVCAKVTPVKGKSKVYEVSIYLGRIDGKVKTKTVRIEGLAAANKKARWLEAHREELLEEAAVNASAKASPRLQDALNQYLSAGEKTWSPKTLATKQHRLNRYLLKELGNIPLHQITPVSLQALQDKLQDSHSSNTTAAIMRTAGAFFEQCVKWEYIQKSPCAGLTRLKAKPAPRRFWDSAQFEQALQIAPVWLRLLMATALRPEELQGLQWDAIQWEENSLVVKAVAYYQKGQWHIRAGAKTANSERKISLDKTTMQALSQHREAAPESSEFVITAPRGGIVPLNTLRVWLEAFCRKNDLPIIPLYSIRHSSLTYLLEQGVMVKTVAARAGHANVSTTLARYAQVSDASAIQAATFYEMKPN